MHSATACLPVAAFIQSSGDSVVKATDGKIRNISNAKLPGDRRATSLPNICSAQMLVALDKRSQMNSDHAASQDGLKCKH